MKKKELTIREFASKGGKATKKKYGVAHFSKLGKLSVKKRKAAKVAAKAPEGEIKE